MPTAPDSDLHPREISADVQTILSDYSAGLEEIVNFGTVVFDWYLEGCVDKADEAAPPSMLLRHFLEYLDAVSVLIKQSVIEPCKPLLRSAYEATLQLEWILEEDSERRGLAFLFFHFQAKKRHYIRFDPKTTEGAALTKKLAGTVYDSVKTEEHFDLSQLRSNIDNILSKPLFKEQVTEYERLRTDLGVKRPKWYQMWGGPNSIESLSVRMDRSAWYEIFYRQWSGSTHASDIIDGKLRGTSEGQHTEIIQLRAPVGVEGIYSIAASMAIGLYRRLVSDFSPIKTDAFLAWYLTNVRDLYQKTSGPPLLVERDI